MTVDRGPSTRVGSRRFERMLGAIVGVFGVPFALQTSDAFLADMPTMRGPVGTAVIVLVLVSVAVGFVAGLSRGESRRGFLAAFLLYVAALAIWPFVLQAPIPADPMPWLATIAPVPLAFVVTVAQRWLLPLVCSALVAADLTVVLSLVGGLGWVDAAVTGGFVFAFGALMTVVVGGVRRAVAVAESAQQSALDRYADARFAHATEDERTRTDALVHDRVLTTFLSAAAARTEEDEELAAKMARTALRVLSQVADPAVGGPGTRLEPVLDAASPQLAPLLRAVDLHVTGIDHGMLPAPAAEALVEAMTQAMVNSVKHAGPRAVRTARIEPFGIDGVRVVVEDDGVGFDPSIVSAERLGVRVSILERMQRVDGRARIDSAPGRGTRVELLWGADLEIAPHADPAEAVIPA